MDMKKAIKWLETYATRNAITLEDMMVKSLELEPEKAREMLAEYEEKRIEMFLEWYNETVDESEEIVLTKKEVFKLGSAYGSFSVGEIDQGIHIVLPSTVVETGASENSVFKSLFNEYFGEIPSNLPDPPDVGLGSVYMGAIQAFSRDNNLGLVTDHFIERYNEAVTCAK